MSDFRGGRDGGRDGRDNRDRSSRNADGRVPPHNLSAEESLLGALLLSRDVVGQVAELGLLVDHFYKPSHQHIYSAIRGLMAGGNAVDIVTVADELRRNGLLDEIGGSQSLLELQNATPAISNAARYAKIVQDTAVLRRLISVAGEITELAYLEPDDVTKALDEAETKVFEVAEDRVVDSTRALGDLLPLAMDKLQETFERGDSITGAATGFNDLDEILSGLQPSTLNIIGARPAMGKTAIGLGIATNVSKITQKPVLIFSLEMGHAELTQRILSSEAEVESQKLRSGRLVEADWTKIGRAINRIDTLPLYLDDNPRVTVMEIRAKARRIKARHGGLALIMIDYLQLMSGGASSENRQLEVSEISRGLKILARELDVPIIALSQLSRNLESRADKRPMLADLRESGCLTADTQLVRADTNEPVTLGELVAQGAHDVPVWSLDEHYRLVEGTVTNAFSSGVKQVFRLRFASGRMIEASGNHPFLTLDGWVRVEEMKVGDRFAAARRLPEALVSEATATVMADDELILLGHLIGDGCTLARHAVQYTTIDAENVEAVTAAARHFGVTARVKSERTWTQVYLPSPTALTHGKHHPISAWLRGLGAWDLRSWEKRIPQQLFSLPPAKIALFLRHLWATDGSVSGAIYYATSSRQLADGVSDLLLRLDIRTRVRVVRAARGRTQFQVEVSGVDNERRFADVVGVHGVRGRQLEQKMAAKAQVRANPNVDSIPAEVWQHVRHKALPAAGMTARELAAALEMSYCGSALYKSGVSRERLGRVAAATDDSWLADLAASDVLWDRLVEIEPLGEIEVFDATVEPHHNFVANGLVAHNSLEQDADVVMFLYRDEVYNRDSPDKASAELIIAKHRSGPTGVARLVWRGQYTKFGNAARGV